MQLFLDCGYFGESLRKLNSCRMHLAVITVSNLITGDGKRIIDSVWHGHCTPQEYRYNWPTQPRSRQRTWNLWQEALKRALTLTRHDQPRLPMKLGQWTVNPHLHWTWFYSIADDRMYEKLPDHWQYYSQIAILRLAHYPIFSLQGQLDSDGDLPPDLRRATVVSLPNLPNHQIRLTGHRNAQFQEKPVPDSLTERLEQLPSSALWAVSDCTFQDDGHDLVLSIRDGTTIGVSDGSYKNDIGTSAWVLEDPTGNRIMGANVIPGAILDQSSYRSKLGGIYAMILLVEQLCLQHHIESGSIEIGCDGLEALLKSFGDFNLPYKAVDYDLLAAIRVKLEKSPLLWKHRHIKGHQDDKATNFLDRWALLNIEMDLLAKAK